MIIEIKYNLGDTFFIPKSTISYHIEKIEHEGKIFKREVSYYESYVSERFIDEIEITIDEDGTALRYNTKKYSNGSYAIYTEAQLDTYPRTYDEALVIAKEYAEKKIELH